MISPRFGRVSLGRSERFRNADCFQILKFRRADGPAKRRRETREISSQGGLEKAGTFRSNDGLADRARSRRLCAPRHPPAEIYPDIAVKTYNADFVAIVPQIITDIPQDAFAYFLIDPKGWRIRLAQIKALLARRNSEITFNCMFEFINRAASMSDPALINGLNELMPSGNWRDRMKGAEAAADRALTPDERKEILAGAFNDSLRELGGYRYVAETTVLRPLRDRPLYCLFHATRHERGIAVFRNCQVRALLAQSKTRATGKLLHATRSSGQSEFFASLHDMGPDDTAIFLSKERELAKAAVIEFTPEAPDVTVYKKLWPLVLSRHVVRLTDVNAICGAMKMSGELVFPFGTTPSSASP
jgi:three-Cys-motif partner protein